ncbi:MAG: hypothetical protein WDW38_006397 [Sanguina aurantia]
MVVGSGLSVPNAYLTFTPGPLEFPFQPQPMTFQLVVAADGSKTFQAKATLFIYASKESKAAGLAAIEERQVVVPTEVNSLMVAGVFDVFYSAMRYQYPNTTEVAPVV